MSKFWIMLATASVLGAPHCKAQNHDVDVSGFRIGMSPEEVRHTVGSGYKELTVPPPDPHLSGFAEQRGNKEQDLYFFTFFDGKLIGLSHQLNFAPNTQPSYEQTLKDVHSKFGPQLRNVINPSESTMFFRFEGGSPIREVPNRVSPDCSQGSGSPFDAYFIEKYRLNPAFVAPPGNTPCWNMTQVKIQIWHDSSNPGLVGQMSITMSNESPIHAFLLSLQQQRNEEQRKGVQAGKQNHAPL